jgi:DNA-directed RNA polymerase specialized sigma24 family protein
MLVKSLTDDMSWQVQRELVNGYFRKREEGSKLRFEDVLQFLPKMVQQVVRYRTEHALTQRETGKILGISREAVHVVEKELRKLGYEPPHYGGHRQAVGTQLLLNFGGDDGTN